LQSNKLQKNSYKECVSSYKECEEFLWRPVVHEKLFFTFMHLHSYVSVHPFFCFFCFAYIFVLPYK
jgi:hypothetical protein